MRWPTNGGKLQKPCKSIVLSILRLLSRQFYLGDWRAMISTNIARAIGWLLLAAAVFLTLGPRRSRPYTGVEHHLEHFLASSGADSSDSAIPVTAG
jgi:hypothetical protein